MGTDPNIHTAWGQILSLSFTNQVTWVSSLTSLCPHFLIYEMRWL